MKSQIFTLVLIGSLAIVSVSCKKEMNSSPDNTTVENIKVPDNFRWKTTSDYQISFTTSTKGIVEVLNDQGIPYQKAFLVPDRAYSMKLIVPAYEKKVYVKHGSFLREVELAAAEIYINFQ